MDTTEQKVGVWMCLGSGGQEKCPYPDPTRCHQHLWTLVELGTANCEPLASSTGEVVRTAEPQSPRVPLAEVTAQEAGTQKLVKMLVCGNPQPVPPLVTGEFQISV